VLLGQKVFIRFKRVELAFLTMVPAVDVDLLASQPLSPVLPPELLLTMLGE
jgi:hypothetical protein